MTGERTIVLGAGIIGAAIAYRLSEAGAPVTVVDGAMPASGASGRSFGWINASFFLDKPHFHLRVAGMEAHRTLAADLGPTGATWPGAISWEETGAGQDRTAATLTALGYPVRRLTRADVARMEPAVRRRRTRRFSSPRKASSTSPISPGAFWTARCAPARSFVSACR